MRYFHAIGAVVLGVVCFTLIEPALTAPPESQSIVPQPIPAKFHFPVKAAIINRWIAHDDNQKIRAHAWDLWAGLSAPSNQIYHGQKLPIWETWNGTNDVFPANVQSNCLPSGAASLTAAASAPRTLRAFVAPSQFHHNARLKGLRDTGPQDAEQVVSFNKFDPAEVKFLLAPQPGPTGPSGSSYCYNSQSSLQALNSAWPATATGQMRGVNQFPVESIELKPVISYVKATGLSIQPLWRGVAGSTSAANPTPATWTTCVLVDPAATGNEIRPATKAEIASAVPGAWPTNACSTYLYGPLSRLYSFKMTADEAQQFAKAQGGSPAAGDFAVLVAMHVNSKEIPDWTWETFYWQPGADTPDGFPGSKRGQPASLSEPWNNYAACAAYTQTTQAPASKMRVCFNPYLETSSGIPDGIASNCISCHGVAVVGANASYPAAYTKPIDFFTDTQYFNNTSTHTDFSWAVPSDAQ